MTGDDVRKSSQDDLENAEALRREVEQLREQLTRATAEAAEYRRAAYAMLNKLVPYVQPTEAELHDLMHGPRGQSLLEVIEEYQRQYGG